MWEKATDKLPFIDNSDEYVVTIQCSTFTEQARYMCQEIYEVNKDGERTNENWNYIGWSFVYILLVILTVAFVLLYGKRVFYMAALTMFAPVIGVMYPINRVNGSRAQTLNLWFKEYMGNLLIQPFHLFLYTIFVGFAMQIAINNPIYVIIALIAILFVERLLKDMFGIQDTRMGGLGKALQDTTRAIKTTERAAASVAKGVGRMASKGARGLVGAYENYRNSSEEVEANKKPREQNMPTEEPVEVLSGEVEDSNTQLSTVVQRNSNAQALDEDNVVKDVPYKEVGSEPLEAPNAEEEFGMPKSEPLRLEMKDDDVEAGAIALDGDDDIIDMDDPMQEQRQLPGFLEPDTIDMLDELNGNEDNIDYDTFNPPALLQEEANSKPLLDTDLDEEFIRSDGERNVYRNRDNGNLRIEPGDSPDFKPPMSVAMAAGNETSSIHVGADRTIGFDDSLESTSRENLRGENRRRTSQLGGNVSTATSYRNLGNSQNIPDDYNVRSKIKNDTSNVRDNLNVWTNPNEPLPSSKERPEITVIDGGGGRNVAQGTTSATIPTSTNSGANVNPQSVDSQNVRTVSNNDINTNNIPNNNIPTVNIPDSTINANNIPNNNTPTVNIPDNTINANNIPNNNIPTVNIPDSTVNANNIPNNNTNTSNTATSSNSSSTANSSNSERIHRLRPDEYQEISPDMSRMQGASTSNTSDTTNGSGSRTNNNSGNAGGNNNSGNAGTNNNAGNAGTNNNANNTSTNNNTSNTGTNTQDTQGDNQTSNNEEREPEQYEARTARRIVDGAEKVAGRTAGVVGTAVSGVIDAATTALSGDVGGAIETGVNTTMDSINIATGSPSRSSRGSGTGSKKATQSSGDRNKEAEKKALEEACKALGINDDRNIALIRDVYEKAPTADKKQVVELSKLLHRMREDGKSKNEAKIMLENGSISNTTRELLLKMYDKLHI